MADPRESREQADTGQSRGPAPDGLRAALAAFVAREAGCAPARLTLWPLASGTMRHACAVDLEIPSGPSAGAHRLIYLADRGGAPLTSHLGREEEFHVLSVMHAAGAPAPRPYWRVAPAHPSGLGPGLILERVDGEVLARRLARDPEFAEVRPRLLAQMGEALARIHGVPAERLAELPRPGAGQSPAAAQLAELERMLDTIGEPHPALELGLRWLQARVPRPRGLVVVHGDYRLGNVLVDPREGLRAVLDWQLAHLGDPGEDLAWVCLRFWRCVDQPDLRGLGPREQFFDGYAAEGGVRLDPEEARYWEVLGTVRWAAVTLAQAYRHLSGAEPSLELASIGRHCAEVEWELLRLIDGR